MKYIMVVLVLLSITTGCAQVDRRVLSGYEGLHNESGVKTSLHLQENEIFMVVRNQYQVSYQVWVVYKFKSKSKNSYVEERIHEGTEYQRNFIVTIPDDKNGRTRESVIVFITSSEVYDIEKIVHSMEKFSHISGGTTLGGFVELKGFSVMKRVKFFQTPEIVLNGFTSEGSYGNSLRENFNTGEVK